jgi:hypothetical protein
MPRQQRIVRLMWMVGALLLIGSTDPASAQARAELSSSGAATLPRCVDLRRPSQAIVIPPEQTPDGLLTALAPDAEYWAGFQLYILSGTERPELLNTEAVSRRLQTLIGLMVRDGWTIDGEVLAVLNIDEDGRVRKVSVRTGSRRLDRVIEETWKRSRFTPISDGECRMPVVMTAPFSFVRSERGLSVHACYGG